MRVSRRGFLGISGGLLAASALPGCGLLGQRQTGVVVTSAAKLPEPYTVPLPIPRVPRPVERAGADVYEITQRTVETEILPGKKTEILGYDGEFPGPTITSRSGRPTFVRHTNRLDVPVAVHLHGGHTPETSDGFPTDLILPTSGDWHTHAEHGGDTTHGHRLYEYPMRQRAATLWYHDHRMDFTGPAVYRGLAGFHLIHDKTESALELPADDRDIPLMLADRAFDGDGAFRYPALDPRMRDEPGVEDTYMPGVLGDVILVNGVPWPELEISADLYRFRILNASNARRYRLELDPTPPDADSPFVQIGSDGGLLTEPNNLGDVVIAPAERFDVVIDFSGCSPDDVITMRNTLGEGSTTDVLRFRVTRKGNRDAVVPDRLSEIEEYDTSQATVTREFEFTKSRPGDRFDGWLINGEPYDPERIDARPELGELELWRFVTDVHHPVHVHLDPFQVTRRGGRGPGRYDSGWKDTVDVRPGEVVEVAIRFTDYTGRYVMHCHNLEHEDMMMMSNFATH